MKREEEKKDCADDHIKNTTNNSKLVLKRTNVYISNLRQAVKEGHVYKT